MSDGLLKAVDGDMATVPVGDIAADDEGERAVKLLVHAFLRVWTRFVLESGYRLRCTPPQYTLGNYAGKMNWSLNETVDFGSMTRMDLGAKLGRRHMLVAEMYRIKGEQKARVFFSLEEEQVKGQPVFVNYLVYDTPTKDFDIKGMVAALKPALPKWLETITKRNDGPLWKYCKDELECVGV